MRRSRGESFTNAEFIWVLAPSREHSGGIIFLIQGSGTVWGRQKQPDHRLSFLHYTYTWERQTWLSSLGTLVTSFESFLLACSVPVRWHCLASEPQGFSWLSLPAPGWAPATTPSNFFDMGSGDWTSPLPVSAHSPYLPFVQLLVGTTQREVSRLKKFYSLGTSIFLF